MANPAALVLLTEPIQFRRDAMDKIPAAVLLDAVFS
jgi:hypothetical protein